MSFLDDGALDVIGTGTVRSMAATVGDDDAPQPQPAKPRMRVRAIAIGGAVAVVGTLALLRITARPGGDAAMIATPTTPAPIAVPPTMPPPIVATPAPIEVPPPPPIANVTPPPVENVTPPAIRHKLARPIAPAAPAILHTVMVNVTPGWAYFTVDDAADQFQTLATIKLTPGAHVIHFARGDTHRDVSIAVPDDDQLKVVVDLSR